MTDTALASILRRFAADENATTAIEYAIIASGITVAIVGAVLSLGSEVRDGMFQKVLDAYPAQ